MVATLLQPINAQQQTSDYVGLLTFSQMSASASTAYQQISVWDYPRKGMFDVVADDISAEVTLDPEGGYYIPFSGTDGSTGGFVRDLSLKPCARFFGAEYIYHDATPTAAEITAASALNTTAIQAMINWTAHHRRIECYVGIGKYYFGRLYLTYDMTGNTGFPTDDHLHGRVILKGEASGSAINLKAGESIGTHLISTDSVGPAILGNGDPLGADRNITNKVRVENMNVEVNNSTWAIEMYRCPQRSGLSDINILQDGAGGGFLMEQRWLSYNQNVYCQGPENSTGIGFHVLNSDTTPNSLTGGFNLLHEITGEGFRVGVMIGGEKLGDGIRSHGYTCSSIQGGDSDVGILIGHNTQMLTMSGAHAENNTIGYHLCSGAKHIKINGATSNNWLDMMLGYGTTGITEVDAVTTAAGHVAADDSVYAADLFMRFDAGTNTRKHLAIFSGAENTRIDRPTFANPSNFANVISAISIEDVGHESLQIIDPLFNGTYPTEIENESKIQGKSATNSITFVADATLFANTTDVPYSSIVYGTNTVNAVYKLPNPANVTKEDGWMQTFINDSASAGFYNIKDHSNVTLLQVLAGESAMIIFNKGTVSWIVHKI